MSSDRASSTFSRASAMVRGCEAFDFNSDNQIDLTAYAGFQGALTGA